MGLLGAIVVKAKSAHLPFSSASRMIPSAARSLTLPPGFWNSALPNIRDPVFSESPFK